MVFADFLCIQESVFVLKDGKEKKDVDHLSCLKMRYLRPVEDAIDKYTLERIFVFIDEHSFAKRSPSWICLSLMSKSVKFFKSFLKEFF